jgi:hypothetical protein
MIYAIPWGDRSFYKFFLHLLSEVEWMQSSIQAFAMNFGAHLSYDGKFWVLHHLEIDYSVQVKVQNPNPLPTP